MYIYIYIYIYIYTHTHNIYHRLCIPCCFLPYFLLAWHAVKSVWKHSGLGFGFRVWRDLRNSAWSLMYVSEPQSRFSFCNIREPSNQFLWTQFKVQNFKVGVSIPTSDSVSISLWLHWRAESSGGWILRFAWRVTMLETLPRTTAEGIAPRPGPPQSRVGIYGGKTWGVFYRPRITCYVTLLHPTAL